MPKVRSKGFSNPAATWDARFSSTDYIFGKTPNVWLAQHSELLIPGGSALAVADGEETARLGSARPYAILTQT